MPEPLRPQVDCERFHATLLVKDVVTAARYYVDKLGFSEGFLWGEPVSFAGVNLGDVQIFLDQGTPNPEGCMLNFVVGNADELFEFQRANGVEVVEPPGDRHYGIRDYSVRELHGYILSFGHYIYSAGPPLHIQRVDVPLRLEKRLAALLFDLAEYKHMSLSGCVEEILLHTNEPLGDGVASPHTKAQLRHIQQLKKKHGIDYDSHASYRFVED